MSYYIHHYGQKKDGAARWRVMFDYYEGGKKKVRQIKEVEWPSLGFARSMSLEDAKSWAAKLNAKDQNEKREVTRNKIRIRLEKEAQQIAEKLPNHFVKEFEYEVLFRRYARSDEAMLEQNKTMSHWRTAQRMIVDLKVEPADLTESPEYIYGYVESKAWSVSYCFKLIRILNLWNKFICKKTNRFYQDIPNPTGRDKQRIHDKYFRKHGLGKKSAPIDMDALKKARSSLKPEQYNWLLVSAAFGLRPVETDNLTEDSTSWRVEKQKGHSVLFIRQDKLTGLDPDKRWKLIPALYPEQTKALAIIKSGEMERPLPKTCKKYLGDQVMTYGGRKAFEDRMSERGHPIHVISVWLGHTNIRTTDQHYRNRLKVAL